LLRDLGAHVLTDDPERVRHILGLTRSERGVMSQEEVGEVDVTRDSVKV